jgi:hypothetical protein
MNYLHYKVNAGPDKIIKVSLSDSANVRLLDTLNYYKYRLGKSYKSSSENTDKIACTFTPPHKGEWHVIVDLAGQGSEVRAFVEVVDGQQKL